MRTADSAARPGSPTFLKAVNEARHLASQAFKALLMVIVKSRRPQWVVLTIACSVKDILNDEIIKAL
ncbi:hypothetical protein [Pleomorphomonas sp. T1.2MG-36]|uniref:hypothetical protein n=1 Tax=Pleomorphomonas sp. T1.2MG-36 TaxID=3041167 RepID=UPI00254018BC|nr:hypothetical protein [Pleomorphomonas sp. T1.2MG-36]